MRLSLPVLHEIIRSLGIPEPGGFPVAAVLAAIATAEGADPDAWVEHDPPSNPAAAPSSGLYQVNRAWWPAIYAATERVRAARLSDREKVLGMTLLVRPILEDALHASATAQRTLARRGLPVSLLQRALLVNAAWQTGSDNLHRWARVTRTGDPGEIVNPKRAVDVESSVRWLAGSRLEISSGTGLLLGLLGAFALTAFALSAWDG